MKKMLALVLSLALLLSMAPMHAVRAEEQKEVYVEVQEEAPVVEEEVAVADRCVIAEPGDEIQITLTLDQAYTVRAGGVYVEFDDSVLEYVGGEWHLANTLLANVDDSMHTGAVAYATATEISGDLFTYTFKVKEDATFGDYDVIFTIVLKDANNQPIDMPTDDWVLTVTDHIYTEVVTVPTCTESGYTTFTCTMCGEVTIGDYTDPMGHSYDAVITAPTCTENGYTTFTCTVCGDTYIGDYTDPTGHGMGEWIVEMQPTCMEEGMQTRFCHCGYAESEVIAPLGHAYSSVIINPSCTENGYTVYSCERCGDVYMDDYTDALGHEHTITPGCAPTCTEEGMTEGAYCATCGEVLIANEAIPALGHTYYIAVSVEPTFDNTGALCAICSICGLSIEVELPALNDVDYTYSVPFAPTYTDTGIGRYTWNVFEYGELYFEVTLDKLIMPSDSVVTVGTVTGKSGDIVEVVLTLSDALDLRALGLSNFVYDTENLTLISAEWLLEDSVLATWDPETMMAAIAYSADTNLNGEIFKLTFQIHEDAPDGEYVVSCDATAKIKPEGSKEITVAVAAVAGGVTVKNYILGDVNNDEIVDTDDAIYLLYHTLFGDDVYAVNQLCDFDGNGVVDTDDAIYLLYHTLFGADLYPLFG